METHGLNIRATAFPEFWGDEYDQDVYLWEGALHDLTLRQVDELEIPILENVFAAREEVVEADEYCRKVFFELMPQLTIRLNDLHRLNLPETFWRRVFGYWLFRHICVAYEKYAVLSKLNIDNTSIRLLAQSSFFVPNDHFDYFSCFTNDFGVQQLVSHYYYCFAEKRFPHHDKEYEQISLEWGAHVLRGVSAATPQQRESFIDKPEGPHPAFGVKATIRKGYRHLLAFGLRATLRKAANHIYQKFGGRSKATPPAPVRPQCDPEIAVSCYFNDPSGLVIARGRELGCAIERINLPVIAVEERPADMGIRFKLCETSAQNGFEYYLHQTLVYCFPKILVEYFSQHFDEYSADIRRRSFSCFMTEAWCSFFPLSIYAAIATLSGRKLVLSQHGASSQWLLRHLCWQDYGVADLYLTTGWKSVEPNIVAGGFRDIPKYNFEKDAQQTLYVGHTNCPYSLQFGEGSSRLKFLDRLRLVEEFITRLPARLLGDFVFRARPMRGFWDVEHALDIGRRNIRVDEGPFHESLLASKIVVIDHLSTGVAEILMMGVPCIIIHDEGLYPLADEYLHLFDSLSACGVVHDSAASAVSHLESIYEDVQGWWMEPRLQQALEEINLSTFKPLSHVPDALVRYVEQVGAEGALS
jgi:hypothetical protein